MPLTTLGVAVLIFACQSAYAQAPAAAKAMEFNMEKMPMGDALLQIARRTGVTISFDPKVVQGYTSAPVVASLGAEKALQAALVGTDLTYVTLEKNVYGIVKITDKTSDDRKSPATEVPLVIVQAKRESMGYAADSTRMASRTNTGLMDLAKSVSTVSRELMDDQQATSVIDALRNVSGIRTDSLTSDTSARLSVRGFTVEQAMTDGMMTSGNQPFDTPTIGIEKLEVVKGPESIIGGTAAKFGGVVNLVTKTPQADPFKQLQFALDRYGRKQAGVDVTGAVTEDRRFRARLVASAEYTGTPYKNWDGGQDYYVAPSVAWKTAQDNLLLMAQFQNTKRPVNAGYLYSAGYNVDDQPVEVYHARDDHANVKNRRYALEYGHTFNPIWKLVVRGQFQKSTLEKQYYTQQPFAYPMSGGPLYVLASDDHNGSIARALQADLTGRFEAFGLDHVASAGLDFAVTNSSGDSVVRFNQIPFLDVVPGTTAVLPSVSGLANSVVGLDAPPQSQRESGLFLQDRVAIGEEWNITGTLRYVDLRSRYGMSFPAVSKVLPGIGIVYKLRPTISLYGSYVEGANANGTARTRGGATLPPMEAKQAEAGIKASSESGHLVGTFALYRIQKKNVAQADLDNSGFVHLVQGQLSRGAELELNGRLSPAWNVSAAYTLAFIDSDPGAPKIEAKHLLNLWANYRLIESELYTGWNLGMGLIARSAERYEIESMNFAGKNPGAVRVDAVVGYETKAWDVKLGVRNLLGRDMFASGSVFQNAQKEQKQSVTLTANIKF
jgi:iron complex outermembrane receptor protein